MKANAILADAASEAVYRRLENFTAESETGPLLVEWVAFYRSLTTELNYQGNLKLGKLYASEHQGYPCNGDSCGCSGSQESHWRQRNAAETEVQPV